MRIDTTCRDPDLLAAEVRRLRAAIAALADQDATLAVQGGTVIVTMDATLTVDERMAIEFAIAYLNPVGNYDNQSFNTLRSLLERMS